MGEIPLAGNRPPFVHIDVAFGIPPLVRPAESDWVRLNPDPVTVAGEPVTVGGLLVTVGEDPGVKVQRLTASRGARIKTGETETGAAHATLQDPEGHLDPSNVLSPYYPNVLPRTRVRFVVEHDDGEDVIWTGFIKSLPLAWRLEVAICSLTAAGLLWLLATGPDLPPSVLHYETTQSAPVAYWPLTEQSGTLIDDVIGVLDGVLTKPLTGNQELVPFDARPNIHFTEPDDDDPDGQRVRVAPFSPEGVDFTFAAWVKMTGDLPNSTIVRLKEGTLAKLGFGIVDVTGDTVMYLTVNDGTNFVEIDSAPIESVWNRKPHRMAITVDGSTGAVVFYWDGSPVGLHSLTTDEDASSVNFTTMIGLVDSLDMGWATNLLTTSNAYTGVVGHVVYWDQVLTASEIADDYTAGTNPWAGDRTGERLGRVLDILGIDADDRDIDTGIQTCSPATLGGSPADYLRKIAATEGGAIFESADGKLTFRQSISNDPTVAHVFSDDPTGDSGTTVEPVEPDFSLDRVINVAKVTRDNGVSQVASNTASTSSFGEMSTSLDTLHSTPSGARARAASLVIRNKDPRLVFPRVVANHIDTTPATLTSTDITDAVTVKARPPRGGDPISQTSIVERVEHRFGPGWLCELGVVEHIVLPTFAWDTASRGFDESVWADL